MTTRRSFGSVGRVLQSDLNWEMDLWDFVIYYSFSTVALKEGNMTFGERAGSLKLKTTQESNLENEVYMHNKTHGFFVTY